MGAVVLLIALNCACRMHGNAIAIRDTWHSSSADSFIHSFIHLEDLQVLRDLSRDRRQIDLYTTIKSTVLPTTVRLLQQHIIGAIRQLGTVVRHGP
jgi:hypothetical protein